jgi:hypothetical protein
VAIDPLEVFAEVAIGGAIREVATMVCINRTSNIAASFDVWISLVDDDGKFVLIIVRRSELAMTAGSKIPAIVFI